MRQKIISFLSEARLFKALSETVIRDLSGRVEWHEYEADHIVFYQGDEAERAFMILSGEVAIETVSPEGRTVSIAMLETGEVFGEMAILDNGVRSANVRTLRPSQLISISKETFNTLLLSHSDFAHQIIRDLVLRLRQSDQQIEAITLLPLRTRLAGLLLDLNRLHGRKIKITQNDLAERLSATREKVNVNLQTLQSLGAVSLGRGRIEILDEDVLGTMIGQ